MSDKNFDDRYPDGYFEHFLLMFNDQPKIETFKEHIDTYIQVEGQENFEKLVEEIHLIDKNEDWNYFLSLLKEYDVENITIENMKAFAAVTVEVYEKNKTSENRI